MAEQTVYGQPISQASVYRLEKALTVTRRSIAENRTGIGLTHLFIAEVLLEAELDRRAQK